MAISQSVISTDSPELIHSYDNFLHESSFYPSHDHFHLGVETFSDAVGSAKSPEESDLGFTAQNIAVDRWGVVEWLYG